MKKALIALLVVFGLTKLTAEPLSRTTITFGNRGSGYTYTHLKSYEEFCYYLEVIQDMDLELTSLTYPKAFLEEIVESNNLDKELLERGGLHIVNGRLFGVDFFGYYTIVGDVVYGSASIGDNDAFKIKYFWSMIRKFYPNVHLPF